MADPIPPYNVPDLGGEVRRHAPATARNVVAIGDVLAEWLPAAGTVVEIASGTGEHALAFARRFAGLKWQPSDPDPAALASIASWGAEAPGNWLAPIELDASSGKWPIERADALLCINMAHISPWAATLGLLDGAARILPRHAPLILYGPWIEPDIDTAPSNLAFDDSLRARDPAWGLRLTDDLIEAARARGLSFDARRAMPANNVILRFLTA